MKFCLFWMLITALAHRSAEDLPELTNRCQLELGISDNDIARYKSEAMDLSDVTYNMKCLSKCLLEQEGVLSNGKINTNVPIEVALKFPILRDDPEKALKALEECQEQKGDNDCEIAFAITLCVYDKFTKK